MIGCMCICHCVFFVRSSLVFRLNFAELLNVQTVLCLYNAIFDVDMYGRKIIVVFLGKKKRQNFMFLFLFFLVLYVVQGHSNMHAYDFC